MKKLLLILLLPVFTWAASLGGAEPTELTGSVAATEVFDEDKSFELFDGLFMLPSEEDTLVLAKHTLQAKADPNFVGALEGRYLTWPAGEYSLLGVAVEKRYLSVATLLMCYGAESNVWHYSHAYGALRAERTPIGSILRPGYPRELSKDVFDIATLLIFFGAEVDARSRDDRTALMDLALCGLKDGVEFLLDHGADVQLRNCLSKTAMDLVSPLRSRSMDDSEKYVQVFDILSKRTPEQQAAIKAAIAAQNPMDAVRAWAEHKMVSDIANCEKYARLLSVVNDPSVQEVFTTVKSARRS